MNEHAKPPFPRQKQPMPGRTGAMQPKPDHGEDSYRGCGKLVGKKAIITGADSGIGRTVALAFAREGADVLVAYLNEHDDAKETQRLIEEAGRKAVLVAGDVGSSAFCRELIERAVSELGGIDILVNNAAHQALKMLGPESPQNFDALKKLWPLGKFPALDDNDVAVFEATSIIEHLALHCALIGTGSWPRPSFCPSG